MFGQIGIPEIMLILVIALLVFGPSKLPSVGKSLGEGITSFKKALNEVRNEEDEDKKPK
jgi:sec-independent protein translocase protein TatA